MTWGGLLREPGRASFAPVQRPPLSGNHSLTILASFSAPLSARFADPAPAFEQLALAWPIIIGLLALVGLGCNACFDPPYALRLVGYVEALLLRNSIGRGSPS